MSTDQLGIGGDTATADGRDRTAQAVKAARTQFGGDDVRSHAVNCPCPYCQEKPGAAWSYWDAAFATMSEQQRKQWHRAVWGEAWQA